MEFDQRYVEKRQFARTPVDLPIWFNVHDLAGYASLREKRKKETGVSRRNLSGVSFPATTTSRREDSDYDLKERLDVINRKLDYLIGLIVIGIPKRDYAFRGMAVELSGNGMRITAPREVATDSCLDMSLELPFFPYFIDKIYGQVKRSSRLEGQSEEMWETAVELLDLDDTVTEELVQLTFEKQRELLRSRRARAQASEE